MSQLEVLINCYLDCYKQLAINAISIVRDADSASDVLQNVVLHLIEKGERLPRVANPKAFLFTCVRNECVSFIRKDSRQSPTDPALLRAQSDMGDDFGRMEAEDFIRRKLARCSREMQDVFLKYALDGYTPRELAAELGIKPKAVSQRLHRMKELFDENDP